MLVGLHLQDDGRLKDDDGVPGASGDGDADGGSTGGKVEAASIVAMVVVEDLVEGATEDNDCLAGVGMPVDGYLGAEKKALHMRCESSSRLSRRSRFVRRRGERSASERRRAKRTSLMIIKQLIAVSEQ